MKSAICLVASLIVSVFGGSSKVSFNSFDTCGPLQPTYKQFLGPNDIINVQFRKPTGSVTVTDECTIIFSASIVTIYDKPRLEVRFDSINRFINDSDVRLEFYDSDDIKVSRKIREISKAQPLGKPGNDTIKTADSFLTIRGIRSVTKSTNYNVEFTIRHTSGPTNGPTTTSSATTARWSLVSVVAAVIIRLVWRPTLCL